MRYRYRNEEEMKESGVDWIRKIPKEVTLTKLKYFQNFINGYAFKSDELKVDQEIPIIRIGDIKELGVDYRNALKIDREAAKNLEQYRIKKDDILIAMSGATVGKTTYITRDDYALINQRVGIIRSKKIKSRFLYFTINNNKFREEILLTSVGGAQENISSENIQDKHIVNFNIEDQDKIAKFLDEKTAQFDSIISKKEELIQKLEEAKKSLISEVVTGKVKVVKTSDGYELVERKKEEMKDSGVEWLGDIPRDWDMKRLRFLGNLQNGISKGGEEFGFGYPFVSYGDVYKNISLPKNINGLVNSTLNERKIYSIIEGDVLFTRTSETVEEIGLASTCLETIKEATFAGFLIRFRPHKNKLYKGFSKYYFRCDLNRKFFVKEMNLVTRASLGQNLLNNLAVALPTLEEQKEIYLGLEQKIGGINTSIEKLKSQILKIKEAKQSLISEAVTGKIEILD